MRACVRACARVRACVCAWVGVGVNARTRVFVFVCASCAWCEGHVMSLAIILGTLGYPVAGLRRGGGWGVGGLAAAVV